MERHFFSLYYMLPPVHINEVTDLTTRWPLVEQYVDQGKDVYIFIHKQGCPPCIATWPHWKQINAKGSAGPFSRNPNVVLVDIDQAVLFDSGADTGSSAKAWLEKGGAAIEGFPTIRLYRRGAKPVDYDWSTYGGPPTKKSLLHFFRDHSTIYRERKPTGRTKGGRMRGVMTKKRRFGKRRFLRREHSIRNSRVRSR